MFQKIIITLCSCALLGSIPYNIKSDAEAIKTRTKIIIAKNYMKTNKQPAHCAYIITFEIRVHMLLLFNGTLLF
jgi:hypothetical protein